MGCATPLDLNPDESALFDKACSGAEHDASHRSISAEAIRHILLGLPVAISGKPLTPRVPQGVRLRNANITGRLDLRNARLGDCCPLPALVLEGCTLQEEINLTCASLARLSLQDSRITILKAIECLIDGPVNLERITSAEDLIDEGANPIQGSGVDGWGLCMVDFAGSLINGSFFANGAQCFVGTVSQVPSQSSAESDSGSDSSPNSSAQPWKNTYALNLRACRIKGSVMLENRFLAYGGVCLAEAHVEGDVWARGATLCAVHARSLHASGTVVEGLLSLAECDDESPGNPHPFQSVGRIDLYGARINNTLNMTGARLAASPDIPDPDNPESLEATSLHVGQAALLYNIQADILINLHGAHIEKSLQMGFAHLKQGMNATSAKIGGEVVLVGDYKKQFHAVGSIHFWDADIKSSFRLESARLDGPLVMNGALIGREFKIVDSTLGKLQAKGIRVDGNVKLASSLKLPVAAEVDFDDAQIGADLELENLLFERQNKTLVSYTIISLKEAHIDGALKVHGVGMSGQENVDSGQQRALRLPFYQRNLPFLSRLSGRGWYLVEHASNAKHRSYLWDGKNRVRHLDGSSVAIHDMNEAQHLVLTKHDVGIYLRFFCGYIQGEEEQPFRLIEPDDLEHLKLPKGADETIRKAIHKAVDAGVQEVGATYMTSSVVLYGTAVFLAEFLIYPDGSVEMVGDTPLIEVVPISSEKYSQGHGAMYGSWEEWPRDPPPIKAERFIQAVTNNILTRKLEVDLTHAQVARLDDDDGLAWGTDFSMKLEGFTYRQSPLTEHKEVEFPLGEGSRHPSDQQMAGGDSRHSSDEQEMNSPTARGRLAHRLVDKYRGFRGYPPARNLKGRNAERHQKRGCWLFLQYEAAEPTGHFSQQPFEAAAGAYRRDGHADEAWRIRAYAWNARFQTRFKRIVLWEPKNFLLSSLWMLLRWPLWVMIGGGLTLLRNVFWRLSYDYGRSFGGALAIIAVLLALGMWGVKFANQGGLLVVDSPPAARVFASTQGNSAQSMGAAMAVAGAEKTVTTSVACGDSINEWIYAMDLLIPLVDLGEENRCRIRSPDMDDAGKSWFECPTFWSIAKGSYEILGWIVISLAIVIRTGAFEQLANARGARLGG